MKQVDLREGARRQHRALALFAVIQCWLNGLEGVAIQRLQLQRLLGLERFKGTRVDWLTEDLKELFPYVQVYWTTRASDSLSSIIISRVPIASHLPTGSMTTNRRLDGMKESAPKLAMFKIWKAPSTQDLQSTFEGIMPFFA